MTSFLKPVLFAGVCVGCLAVAGGAQTPAPPVAAPPPVPAPGAAVILGGTGQAEFLSGDHVLTTDRVWYAQGFGRADGEALKLAKQIAEAKTDGEKDKLRDKMKDVLDKAFEERQKRHEKEIDALEAQVKRLKEMVSKRKEAKREIIDERMKQLQREAAGLGW
jgi:hypothetical protein